VEHWLFAESVGVEYTAIPTSGKPAPVAGIAIVDGYACREMRRGNVIGRPTVCMAEMHRKMAGRALPGYRNLAVDSMSSGRQALVLWQLSSNSRR